MVNGGGKCSCGVALEPLYNDASACCRLPSSSAGEGCELRRGCTGSEQQASNGAKTISHKCIPRSPAFYCMSKLVTLVYLLVSLRLRALSNTQWLNRA